MINVVFLKRLFDVHHIYLIVLDKQDIVHLACIIGYYLLPSLLMLVFRRLNHWQISAIFLIITLPLPLLLSAGICLSPEPLTLRGLAAGLV